MTGVWSCFYLCCGSLILHCSNQLLLPASLTEHNPGRIELKSCPFKNAFWYVQAQQDHFVCRAEGDVLSSERVNASLVDSSKGCIMFSMIASIRNNISMLIGNSVKNRDNLKNVLQSVYINKEAVDDELVEVTIFLIKPSETVMCRRWVFIERRHCLVCNSHKCLKSLPSRVIPITLLYLEAVRNYHNYSHYPLWSAFGLLGMVQIIRKPATTEGALDAFVSIITGPPGPKPTTLPIHNPMLVLWGDEDPFTPINGPVGKYFQGLPKSNPKVVLHLLQGVGHCPQDDRPDLVHEKLLPWLAELPALTWKSNEYFTILYFVAFSPLHIWMRNFCLQWNVGLLYLRTFTQGRKGGFSMAVLLLTSSQIPLAVCWWLESGLGFPFTPKKIRSDVILPLRIFLFNCTLNCFEITTPWNCG